MANRKLYPLKFRKVFKEKVWGGRSFESVLGMTIPERKDIGESWEVSTHPNGPSVVDNGELAGTSIISLIDEDRVGILGKEIADEYEEKFPLLIKFLDINDKLSIQVHPDNAYAIPNEGEFGKEESWYIMDASDDAELIIGFKPGKSLETFDEAYKNGDLESQFNIVKVKAGDILNVKPGTVHGTYTGSVLIAEVQQNSDVTYRVFDYDRIVDGQKRELHIEKAREVFNFDAVLELTSIEDRAQEPVEGAVKDKLTSCDKYTMERYEVNGLLKDGTYKNFRVFSILDGEGEFYIGSKREKVEKGETFFIPAGMDIALFGENLEVLKVYL